MYWPGLPDTGMLVYCSIALKVMYGLSSVAPWKLKVWVAASTSMWDDAVICRLLQVPKRASEAAMAQRSAAQYGQYSAP